MTTVDKLGLSNYVTRGLLIKYYELYTKYYFLSKGVYFIITENNI